MAWAKNDQQFQDWFSQQWNITFGKRITTDEYPWLCRPFGLPGVTGEQFMEYLAKKEGLTININPKNSGLLSSFYKLEFSENHLPSSKIIHFYEKTTEYNFTLKVEWNKYFRILGNIVSKLFSKRIQQLNVPLENFSDGEQLTSEIIQLTEKETDVCRYTFWLRKKSSDKQVIYSGIYDTCRLPDGRVCIKTVFPLPNGNATVIMEPSVGKNGELILESSGDKFGDPGFYFLVEDSKGRVWTQYIQSFKDRITVVETGKGLIAKQILTLWKRKLVAFEYSICSREQ